MSPTGSPPPGIRLGQTVGREKGSEPQMFKRIRRDEIAQTMAEYAVVLGLISVGLVLALTDLGATIADHIANATALIPH